MEIVFNTLCKKRSYLDERSALDRRKEIKEKQGKKSLRAYKCPYCSYWHLTHQRQYGNR